MKRVSSDKRAKKLLIFTFLRIKKFKEEPSKNFFEVYKKRRKNISHSKKLKNITPFQG